MSERMKFEVTVRNRETGETNTAIARTYMLSMIGPVADDPGDTTWRCWSYVSPDDSLELCKYTQGILELEAMDRAEQ